ncbi:HDAC_interact domain-containing protein [Haematococcus lacustris]|uniref:HDAC_interact domain-containing protein n=1 Tax=Haematococcus lacustris TaxID=44745 RepID=A0A699Z5W1_HAELA|nr:HDAC_interact domain-containing protein [Haematococcus lacustris]
MAPGARPPTQTSASIQKLTTNDALTYLREGYEIELARISDDEEDEEPAQGMEMPAKQPVEFDQAINYVNKIKSRFNSDERVYKAFLEILNMYRKGQKTIGEVYDEVAVLFRNHKDLLEEFTYFLPDNSTQLVPGVRPLQPMRAPPGTSHQRGFQGAPPMRHAGSNAQGNGRSGGGGSPVDHSRVMHKRKAARKAEEGFRKLEDEDAYAAGSRGRPLGRELQFLEKVKMRLRSREAYGDFMKCLNMFSQDIISRSELVHLVADIFGKMPDLMNGFTQFLHSCEHLDTAELSASGGASGRPLPLSNREVLKQKLQKDKFMTKPLSELVASETERITPSYVKMPPGYPRLVQSGRTPLGSEVLNDQYVNVITGSEDYSFKLMRKNQYEEALFRCEDDRYEFDIVCEQNASAMRVLRPVAERLSVMSAEERANFRIEDVAGLNQVHTGHIQRLYGDQGSVLLELLVKNPAVAIPVVLHRLEAKDVEWRKVKDEMTRAWRKIYEQNYPRSLDHRSFYFKQQEKKNMMTKAMVAEIKEAADRRKADEQQLRILSMAHRYVMPAVPQPNGNTDLSFVYADRTIFEDVYHVLRIAIQQTLHAGAREQVLLLYLQHVEAVFGIPERTTELERLKAEVASGKSRDISQYVVYCKSDSSDADEDKTHRPGMDLDGEDKAEEGTSGEVRPKRGPSSEAHDRDAHAFASCRPIMPLLSMPQPSLADPANASSAQGGDKTHRPGMDLDGEDKAEEGTSGEVRPKRGPSSEAHDRDAHAFASCRPIMPLLSMPQPSLADPANASSAQGGIPQKVTASARAALPLNQSLPVPTSATVAEAADAASRGAQLDPIQQAAIKEDASRTHATFVAMLRQTLGSPSSSDPGAFEDSVRSLLGTNSYELFTLDKLLSKLAKHMQLMAQEEHSCRLWDMFSYERARRAPIAACVYHVNCHTLMEDSCFRIEFREDDGTLRFQMNDPEKSDPHAVIESTPTQYIRGFVSGGPTPPALLPTSSHAPSPLYLKRNLPGPQAGQGDEQLLAALQLVLIQNGLECKIACATDKVSYVLDTEDVLARKKRRHNPQPAAQRDLRVQRFAKWMSSAHKLAAASQQEEEQAVALLSSTARA